MTTSNLVPVPPNSIFGGNQYNLTYNEQANAFTVDGLNSGITVEWLQENFAPVAGSAGGVFSVGVASQPVQAPRSSQVATDNLKFAADTSTVANTITIALPLPTNTLVNGQPFVVQVANTNTGPTNLQILTAAGVVVAVVPVQSMAGALQGGELIASSIWVLRYNSSKKAMVVQGIGAGNPATQSNQVVTLGQLSQLQPLSGSTHIILGAGQPGSVELSFTNNFSGILIMVGNINVQNPSGLGTVDLLLNGDLVGGDNVTLPATNISQINIKPGTQTVSYNSNGAGATDNSVLYVSFIFLPLPPGVNF